MSILEQTARFMRIGGQLAPDKVGANADHQLRMNLLAEEVEEYGLAEEADDRLGVADGLCDIIVVAMGTLIAYFGPDTASRLLHEVGVSNLSKFVEGEYGTLQPLLREDGKILKGPGFRPPRIQQILEIDEEWS